MSGVLLGDVEAGDCAAFVSVVHQLQAVFFEVHGFLDYCNFRVEFAEP